MRQRKSWTKEELEYLENNWGSKSIKAIAKGLGRTTTAVKVKAQRIGLGDARTHFDGITVSQLCQVLQISYSHTIKAWIENYGFPVKHKTFAEKKRVRVISYEDFWKWAEENKRLLDFSKLEENILGPEPYWVKEKRKADFIRSNLAKNTPWTEEEDKLLESLLNTFKYTYPEIARRLQRSEAAVKRRIGDLGIKARPLRLNNHVKYTPQEEKLLVSLYKKGYCVDYIAEKLGKSALGVRGKLERMGYKFRNDALEREIS